MGSASGLDKLLKAWGGQRFILSPEQQKESANFQRKEEVDVKAQLKTVREQVRAEIDSPESRVEWLNIAAIPAVVTLSGLGLAFLKRRQMRAR